MSEREQVLTVARADHFGGDWPQGFEPLHGSAAASLLARLEASAAFTDRESAETDPSRKQLIPYCAVVCGDRVLCVQRLTTQGERRLHGRLSIGIGGHINPVDQLGPGIIARARDRELDEELHCPPEAIESTAFLGILNDDGDPVGAVHAGLVFLRRIRPGREEMVQVREISKMAGSFRGLAGSSGLWQDLAKFESWSRLLVGGLPRVIGVLADRDSLEGADD